MMQLVSRCMNLFNTVGARCDKKAKLWDKMDKTNLNHENHEYPLEFMVLDKI